MTVTATDTVLETWTETWTPTGISTGNVIEMTMVTEIVTMIATATAVAFGARVVRAGAAGSEEASAARVVACEGDVRKATVHQQVRFGIRLESHRRQLRRALGQKVAPASKPFPSAAEVHMQACDSVQQG